MELPQIRDMEDGWAFFCPGCKCGHMFAKDGRWTFNGDLTKPTFSPSLLYSGGHEGQYGRCHLFLRDGMIQFLSDCGHELAGQTVPFENF